MAQRRMFALSVVDTDTFLDMPASTQNLYFHLGMRADDDGFISNPRKITTFVNCSTDDLKLLIAKGLIIPFDSGVCVVRDWRINNYIQKDRYRETRYLTEKRCLSIDESGAYNRMDTPCIQNVSSLDTQVRLGEDRVSLELGEGKRVADKPPCPPPLPDTFFGPELQSTFEQWLLYKKERREGYKPTGLNALVTQIKNNAATYGEHDVIQLIETSMASGWKGIAFDRLKQGNRPQAADNRNRLRTDSDYQSSDDFFGGG